MALAKNNMNSPPINLNDFFIRFWGVRGSIASPGPDTFKYGGNTACVEVQVAGHIFILDGGTGLRRFGTYAIKNEPFKHFHIFLSHLHWDHIQGIPFFTPAFIPGNKVTFYGERKGDQSLKSILEAQMHSPNFPVPLSIMQADINFIEVNSRDLLYFDHSVEVRTTPMNHPNGCIGVRINYQGHSVVYNTDTEHDPSGNIDQNVVDLAKGADLLIYDSMYTEEEYYAGRIGWGHSTYNEALRVAQAAGVKKLLFYHHDPEHNDDFLDQQLLRTRALAKDLDFQVDMCREGDIHRLL
jgi:phosphoribosyl 1,2-cyclic phosphodiesterase